MKLFFFLFIAASLYSQSVFDLNTRPIYIHAESVDDIREFNLDSIPPYIYTHIPDLRSLDVQTRKKKFIQLILPAILFEKSKIHNAFNNIDNTPLSELYSYCNCISKEKLEPCLSSQPNSIILAQAAIESGWGTSRFFMEGLNLFGVHSFSKNDKRIQAKGGDTSKPIYVKKYDNISASISDYLRTLAKSYAYEDYRNYRAQNDSVLFLIKYLDKYSERRQDYIDDLERVIKYNNFIEYDLIEIDWQ